MNDVDPTREDVRAFMAHDDGEPIVMLNLLRYDGEQGRRSYGEYLSRARKFFGAVGGRVIYAGDCGQALVAPEGDAWDSVLLVEYPSRSAFLEMVKDPAYQQITELRTRGLSAAVLQPTSRRGDAA